MKQKESVYWVGVVELVTAMGTVRFVGDKATTEGSAVHLAKQPSSSSPLRRAEAQAQRFRDSFGDVPLSIRTFAERVTTVTQVFVKSNFQGERIV